MKEDLRHISRTHGQYEGILLAKDIVKEVMSQVTSEIKGKEDKPFLVQLLWKDEIAEMRHLYVLLNIIRLQLGNKAEEKYHEFELLTCCKDK